MNDCASTRATTLLPTPPFSPPTMCTVLMRLRVVHFTSEVKRRARAPRDETLVTRLTRSCDARVLGRFFTKARVSEALETRIHARARRRRFAHVSRACDA